MKFFIFFFLLASLYPFGANSHNHYKKAKQRKQPLESERTVKTEEILLQLEDQINKYTDSLMLVLLSEDTPQANKIEIIKEIQSLSDKNEKIKGALLQISQKGIAQEGGEAVRDENISVWATAQSELLKREQSEVDDLVRRLRTLTTDFYIDLAFNGAVIVVGGALFFIPAGQGVGVVLTAERLTLTAKKLGVLLASMGFLEGAIDASYFLNAKEQKVISFVSNLVITNPFARELLRLLSSTDENDRYLARDLFQGSTKNLIRELVGSIGDDIYSITARESLINALRGFPNVEEEIRREAIEALKRIIDNSSIPALRETSVSVLGEIGKEKPEVAEYLQKKGTNEDEDDKLRLLALTQLGRDQEYFPVSVNSLTEWFKDIDITNPLSDPLEIPNSFVTALLTEKQERLSEELLESHKRVVREFIRLNLLDIGLKFRFSETLISWDDSPETKDLLRDAWTNPAEDMGQYVEQLRKESLSDENYQAFEFLKTEIDKRKGIKNTKVTLRQIDLIIGKPDKIGEFDAKYPDQKEISEKLKVFVGSYKEMLENIKKL